MSPFLHIRTEKFPVLPGEEEEIVNPGTFGKSFAQFIEGTLKRAEYDVPFIVCEDWGWWVEVKLPQCRLGITCYRDHDENTMCDFACSPSPPKERVWSWTRFRFVDIAAELVQIRRTLVEAFTADPEINFLGEVDEIPLYQN
ncbi:hypothetical protein [Roseibacillus persicicus]|uniref:Uncharacterized protein n=1 Tax=Roseibacillus persicicus TaxID=454148 RepID=A0A918TZ04_9BACT|nr:hypothetical protein [Roseibacillus persicicus]GHC68842.1 hypothetical protein GCM10007100_40590 [Roseibacillus persicicus]